MIKKHVQLVPATLLCFLFACQAAPTKSMEQSFPTSESQSSVEPIVPLPTESAPPVEESASLERKPSDFWSFSDLDVSEIDASRKLISFTFDDAPSRTLESILTVFASFNEKNPDCKASATVFCNGGLFDAQTPHLLHAALALGFELGNHTHSHANLTTLTGEEIKKEIERTDALLSKIDEQPYHLLRAPFGRVNELVKELSPVPLIDWTIDTLDWTGVSANDIYHAVFDKRFSGAIVLMHDGYEGTVSALKRLLPDLKADGYQVVSVSKMAKMHDCKLKRGNVYIRARKQKATR